MQVFLIRHSPPQIAAGICYGRLDVPARDVDRVAAALRERLPPGLPVFSSPLRRCRALAEALHPAPRFADALMEMDFGEWEGRPWDEIGRTALDAWAADLANFAPPGGESATMLQDRVVAGLDAIAAEGVPACIVVTHAGAMRAAIGHRAAMTVGAWSQLRFAHGECRPLRWGADDQTSRQILPK